MIDSKNAGKSGKKKIAVMGGGLGSLSAVYELTDYPDWKDHYDITVYQIGWRLGGKTATGRGKYNRIEEKGIHIFQGWYDNAFRMVKDAYRLQEEWKLNPQSPLKKWSDAIVPDNSTLFTEWSEREGKWINWPIIFPKDDREPGTDGKASTWELIRKILGISLQLVVGDPYEKNEDPLTAYLMEQLLDVDQQFGEAQPRNKKKPHWWDKVVREVKKDFHKGMVSVEVIMLKRAVRIADENAKKEKSQHLGESGVKALEEIVYLFSAFTHWMERIFSHTLHKNDKLRRIVSLIEWVEVTLSGVLADVYNSKTGQLDYENINDYNYLDWLKKHGASDWVLDCAPVRFMYTGSFANLLKGGTGQLAADIGLRMVMVSVDYKGCLVWKLAAGTGDTLITPIYQVLKERGVEFKFFHKVLNLHPSSNGTIDQISMAEQVKLKDDSGDYHPFIHVDGLNSWPAHPNYEQLDSGQAVKLREGEIDLESSWADWNNYREFKLEKGTDFDEVLLGISIAALKHICPEIIDEKPAWKNMVEKVESTQTVQVQIWTKPTLRELGMKTEDWGMKKGSEPNSVIYANYLYSWTDMSLIINSENWPESIKPGHLSYWCGTLPDACPMAPFSSHWFPKTQMARLMGITEQWLYSHGGWLWPNATTRELPQGFDFDLLTPLEVDGELTPIQKFYQQFFMINIEPSDRYVLALPGTNKYRLKADESGYSNLFLTGDWIDFGFNVGHMEGAVTAGLKAAQAIRKHRGLESNNEIY